jgi:RES domain-containing protein
MTVRLWRVATDTPRWAAEDLSGKGAASGGGRWNEVGELVSYASTSISLAAWETRAHIGRATALPWNRYLVAIAVPDEVWAARSVLPQPPPVGWEAIPEGGVSRSLGSRWLAGGASALLAVPSVIVPEEFNVLINPTHAHAQRLRASKQRRFIYDPRI